MWVSNENLHNTKVVDLEKLCKSGIQHFSIWALQIGDNFRLPRGPWNFRNHIYALISISLSPGCSVRAARRTPPVDFVHRAPAAKWTRGSLSAPPGPPLGTSSRPHASQAASRAATTPPPCAAPLPLRPLAVVRPWPKSTAPSRSIPHPGARWPIKTHRTPQTRPFFPFFLLPPLRHGRRDPALADRLAQPHIAPSDHRNSFATS